MPNSKAFIDAADSQFFLFNETIFQEMVSEIKLNLNSKDVDDFNKIFQKDYQIV